MLSNVCNVSIISIFTDPFRGTDIQADPTAKKVEGGYCVSVINYPEMRHILQNQVWRFFPEGSRKVSKVIIARFAFIGDSDYPTCKNADGNWIECSVSV